MSIRESIKRLIPKSAREIYAQKRASRRKVTQLARYRQLEFATHANDIDRDLRYSKLVSKTDIAEKILSSIVEKSHVIEKGLTLSSPIRLGFGQSKIAELIDLCDMYIEKYGATNEMLLDAISVLSEYDALHKDAHFVIDNVLQVKIERLRDHYDDRSKSGQLSFLKDEYFSKTNSPFDVFSKSRHSLRDFSPTGDIDLSLIEKAIELAQNAPSSCNRQSTRVHVIANKTVMGEVLSLQNGNRGFGDRANKVIIITADLQDWLGNDERFGPYIDTGIYIMNLLYALHFYKIGACALNWYAPKDKDVALRSIAGIPDNEVIAVIIACGLLKDEFKIARSKRKNYRSIMRVVQ